MKDFLPIFLPSAIGAIAVLGGAKFSKDYEERKKRIAVRKAILTEIRSILFLVERRDFLLAIDSHIKALEKGTVAYFSLSARRNFTKIYDANLQNIAYLDDAAQNVVEFYIAVNATLENNDDIADMRDAHRDKSKPYPVADVLRVHRNLLADIEVVVACAKKAIDCLEAVNARGIFFRG